MKEDLEFVISAGARMRKLNIVSEAENYTIDELVVFSHHGKLVKKESFRKKKKASMDIAKIPSGSYILSIKTAHRRDYRSLSIKRS